MVSLKPPTGLVPYLIAQELAPGGDLRYPVGHRALHGALHLFRHGGRPRPGGPRALGANHEDEISTESITEQKMRM